MPSSSGKSKCLSTKIPRIKVEDSPTPIFRPMTLEHLKMKNPKMEPKKEPKMEPETRMMKEEVYSFDPELPPMSMTPMSMTLTPVIEKMSIPDDDDVVFIEENVVEKTQGNLNLLFDAGGNPIQKSAKEVTDRIIDDNTALDDESDDASTAPVPSPVNMSDAMPAYTEAIVLLKRVKSDLRRAIKLLGFAENVIVKIVDNNFKGKTNEPRPVINLEYAEEPGPACSKKGNKNQRKK